MEKFNNTEYQKEYRKSEKYIAYMESTKEKRAAYLKEWRKNNPNKPKEYRENNPEKIKKYKKEYFQRRKHIAYKRANERWKTDLDYRLRTYLRKRIRAAIKQNFKAGKSIELLGCSVTEFKNHIESQFKEGMNWNNYGSNGWHIDHIKPIASFDFKDIEQQKICFHYTNMQPLWEIENKKKGSKI